VDDRAVISSFKLSRPKREGERERINAAPRGSIRGTVVNNGERETYLARSAGGVTRAPRRLLTPLQSIPLALVYPFQNTAPCFGLLLCPPRARRSRAPPSEGLPASLFLFLSLSSFPPPLSFSLPAARCRARSHARPHSSLLLAPPLGMVGTRVNTVGATVLPRIAEVVLLKCCCLVFWTLFLVVPSASQFSTCDSRETSRSSWTLVRYSHGICAPRKRDGKSRGKEMHAHLAKSERRSSAGTGRRSSTLSVPRRHCRHRR